MNQDEKNEFVNIHYDFRNTIITFYNGFKLKINTNIINTWSTFKLKGATNIKFGKPFKDKFYKNLKNLNPLVPEDNFIGGLCVALLKLDKSFDNKNLYFLESEDGLIKIGVSTDVDNRIKDIKKSLMKDIKILKTINYGAEYENDLHNLFSHINSSKYLGTDGGTEWFLPDKLLLKFIKKVNEDNIEKLINEYEGI